MIHKIILQFMSGRGGTAQRFPGKSVVLSADVTARASDVETEGARDEFHGTTGSNLRYLVKVTQCVNYCNMLPCVNVVRAEPSGVRKQGKIPRPRRCSASYI